MRVWEERARNFLLELRAGGADSGTWASQVLVQDSWAEECSQAFSACLSQPPRVVSCCSGCRISACPVPWSRFVHQIAGTSYDLEIGTFLHSITPRSSFKEGSGGCSSLWTPLAHARSDSLCVLHVNIPRQPQCCGAALAEL